MSGDLIHIALAANHRYVNGLLVTMVSIMRSTSFPERLRFHVFSDGLSPEDKTRVCGFCREYSVAEAEFHEPDLEPIRRMFSPYRNSHAAFLRLFLSDFLDIDWVIYSDVDTMWLKDVAELWGLRDPDVSIQWCIDLPSIRRGAAVSHLKWNPDYDESRYGCSGVMLMNLRRQRENGFVARCGEFVAKWGTPPFVDQDIINFVCRDDVGIIPQVWDCLNPTREATGGLVYHFNGIGALFNSGFSGWRPLYYPWFRFFYDFILKSPERQVCSAFKRVIFRMLGAFYPNRGLIGFLVGGDLVKTDAICRQLFFAWLWRRRKKF